MRVCLSAEGGSIPRHKLLSFLESLWPTQEERVGGGGGGGEGAEALGEQSLISNLPKTGVFMLWCWGPLLCREMLSQRCNIHLGIGPGGGCIGLQCYTKYPGALTSLMKSPLAAATHYCTLLCLSHGDLSLYLSVCLSVSLPGWLLTTAVCVTVGHILSTLIVCLYSLLLVCFVLVWWCLFACVPS